MTPSSSVVLPTTHFYSLNIYREAQITNSYLHHTVDRQAPQRLCVLGYFVQVQVISMMFNASQTFTAVMISEPAQQNLRQMKGRLLCFLYTAPPETR